jgi:hypothetical protein
MYLLAWIDTVEEWLSPFRAWFAENSKSPLFWFAYFLLGVLIFTITYRALNKDR